MLQASNTKQVSLQVMLKRETKKQIEGETENTFDDVNLENLILKLNGKLDSSEYDKTNDPFDKQLRDLTTQLEEECKEVNAIGYKRNEMKNAVKRDQTDSTKAYIGKAQTKISRTIKQEVHVKEETEIRNEMEMPRKRTNSEVADHKAKAMKALKDLKIAEVEVHMLR